MERKSQSSELERKGLPFEVKSIEEGGSFEGYAAVFGVKDAWGDIILAGAFKASLREHKSKKTMPSMLWQHRYDQPIGVWDAMQEDSHGLYVKGSLLLKVQQGLEAYELLKAGALSGMSIGYIARDFSIDEKDYTRTIKRIDLYEASLVTFPANEGAQVVAVKAQGIKTIREFEAALRDVMGFSPGEAKRIASRGFKAREAPDCSAEIGAIVEQITKKYS